MMTSTRSLARIGGLLYLGVAVGGAFSELFVRSSVTVQGDAAATAANIVSHAGLFRLGLVSDLVDLVCFLGVALLMYAILKPVNQHVALAMLVINAVSVAIQAANLFNHAGALVLATNPSLAPGVSSLFLLEMHRQGYLIAQIFFGGYLLPLGYLVYKSGLFPRALGVVLMVGCAGYLGGIAASYLAPTMQSGVATDLSMIGGLAELTFLLWLLIVGARVPDRVQAPDARSIGEAA